MYTAVLRKYRHNPSPILAIPSTDLDPADLYFVFESTTTPAWLLGARQQHSHLLYVDLALWARPCQYRGVVSGRC